MPLEAGVRLGGAWMAAEEARRGDIAARDALGAEVERCHNALLMAEEDRAAAALAGAEVRAGRAAEARNARELRARVGAAEAAAATAERALTEAAQSAAGARAAVATEAENSAALRTELEEAAGVCMELRARLTTAEAEAAATHALLRQEKTTVERLLKDLETERKRTSMLQAVRDQKDKHICMLVRERDRLGEQVLAALRHTKGRRAGPALKKELDDIEVRHRCGGGARSCGLVGSRNLARVGCCSSSGAARDADDASEQATAAATAAAAASEPAAADALALRMIRKLRSELEEERRARAQAESSLQCAALRATPKLRERRQASAAAVVG